jgi:hypothetical protein
MTGYKMAKANQQEKGNKTPVEEGATVDTGHYAKNAMDAWYNAEKTRGFEPDFDWDGWPEADGDLNEEELDTLSYEMGTGAIVSS